MKLNRNQIKYTIFKILSNYTHSQDIKETDRFIEDLGMDSLDASELLMAVEENFNLNLDDDKFAQIKTVGKLIDFIYKMNLEIKDFERKQLHLKLSMRYKKR
jgi:acyl carrier protein